MEKVKNVVLITQGLTRVVEPIVNSTHNIVAIVDAPSRNANKIKKTSIIGRIIKQLMVSFGLRKKTLKEYCKDKSINYIEFAKTSESSFIEYLKKNKIDLLVIYSMSQLLKESIFIVPKYGTINLHPSFLPKYRGPNPWFWSYLNGDDKGGVTVHFIDKGEDTGDIIYQEEYKIEKGIKSPQMQDLAIGEIGSRLLVQAINNIPNIERIVQPTQSPTPRAKNLKIEEHGQIIDWENWDIEKIWHILRGTELWLNAIEQPIGLFKNMRWSVENFDKNITLDSKIGSLEKYKNNNVVVCEDGIIYLKPKFVFSIYIRNLIGKLK